MIEGKWLKDKEKKKKKKEIKDAKELEIKTRLVTYEEEKDWLKREKDPSSQ